MREQILNYIEHKKYTNKEPVTVFDLYKHIIKKESDSIIHNEVDILYRDLIKLFYYHIKKINTCVRKFSCYVVIAIEIGNKF